MLNSLTKKNTPPKIKTQPDAVPLDDVDAVFASIQKEGADDARPIKIGIAVAMTLLIGGLTLAMSGGDEPTTHGVPGLAMEEVPPEVAMEEVDPDATVESSESGLALEDTAPGLVMEAGH